MIKKGVYAAGLSVLNTDRTLNIDATINHATQAIQNGLHGIFFFGSTGQSQLISTNEKKELITRIANHKLKKQFFLGVGNNSLNEHQNLISSNIMFEFGSQHKKRIEDWFKKNLQTKNILQRRNFENGY